MNLEIDGWYHRYGTQPLDDTRRNAAFKENGYAVIRILNEDMRVRVVFLERLIEGLTALEPVGERRVLPRIISELEAMAEWERRLWIEV